MISRKRYDVKKFKWSMFYLMTCVSYLNFSNSYSDNYSIIVSHIHIVYMTYSVIYTLCTWHIQSYTHCIYDLFRHIYTAYVTYLIIK